MYSIPGQRLAGTRNLSNQLLPEVHDLIEGLYAAAEDPSLWPEALRRISTALGGESILLFAGAPDARTPALYTSADMPADCWEAYSTYYANINPLMAVAERTLSPDVPWLSSEVMRDADFVRTEFLNDFFRPYGIHYALGLRIESDGGPSASLTSQRSRQMGTFTPEAVQLMAALRPHVRRAVSLYHRLLTLEARTLGLQTALELHDHAVLGLDGQGQVCLSNSPAETILAAGDGLRMVAGQLRCTRPEEDTRWLEVLASLLPGADVLAPAAAAGTAMLIRRRRPAPDLQLTTLPLRRQLPGRSSPLAVLVLLADRTLASSRADVLRALYGATPSETRVADLLLAGLDLREIAEQRHLSLETVRFLTKTLLRKTGTRRQPELLRLLAALPTLPPPATGQA